MNGTSTELKRWTAIYSGRVQGVGFRQTVRRIARRYPVTGYVCNLHDGTVEIAVECRSEVFQQFNSAIHEVFTRNIDDVEVRGSDATGEFADFQIRH